MTSDQSWYQRPDTHGPGFFEWWKYEIERRRRDTRPLRQGEVVEALVGGAGPDYWTMVVRGPIDARLDNDELPDGLPGGIVSAFVAEIHEDTIYITRFRP